jgi:hypothetical protein
MKSLNQIYNLVLESFLLETIKDDAIKKFDANSIYLSEPADAQYYVTKFWDEIRHKETDPKKKDINYWLKEGFQAFIDYVDNFKSKKDIKKDNQSLTSVDNGNGKLLEVVDDYELWQVDSYEASRFLGRDYKNMPTKWCISSDTPVHWFTYYNEDDIRFYFLISKTRHGTNGTENIRWDKIAIAVIDNKSSSYSKEAYDLYDNAEDNNIMGRPRSLASLPENIRLIIEKIKDKLVWYKNINLTPNERLIKGVEENNLEAVKEALKNNADIHHYNSAALRYATANENLDIVKYLVEYGANIHVKDDAPLRIAVDFENLDIVKYLVEHGADIHARNDTPIQNATGKVLEYFKEILATELKI